MNILLVATGKIPAHLYGGTERVIWYLGKELVQAGHRVTYLVGEGSRCDFAEVLVFDKEKAMVRQIPEDIDVVHFNFIPEDVDDVRIPYIITIHGNPGADTVVNRNAVFVSRNHAERYNSDSYVYNGLDWSDYTFPSYIDGKRNAFHFLGNAAWRVKNVKGAINVVRRTPGEKINILGGVRFNFKMGLRFTFTPKARFYGMVGGERKESLLQHSKGLIFPVRWHEPFGLAVIESLFYGCPVFSTPYGSLPELVPEEMGVLSAQSSVLSEAIKNVDAFSPKKCHEYAVANFNAGKMAQGYLKKYEKVLNGETLNPFSPGIKQRQTEKFLPWE